MVQTQSLTCSALGFSN